MIRKMYEYRIIPKNDENLFKSYLCFYAESTLSHKVDEVARNRANTMAFMLLGRYHVDYELELVHITEVESDGTNPENTDM